MSKELEALEIIKHTTNLYMPNELNGYKEELDIIEKALKRLVELEKMYSNLSVETAKELKALEIIKEKLIIPAYIVNTENVEKYNKWLKGITFKKDWLKRALTQEEYDLLKEVLL